MIKNWQRVKNDSDFRARMQMRSEIIFAVRQFFRGRDFFEAETPTAVVYPGMEPNLDPLATEVVSNDGRKFSAHLITSPEYSLKKLLAAGYERLFEITRCYRNCEPFDGTHNPEFTMIEWYRARADYRTLMEDTEQLVSTLAQKFCGRTQVEYQGRALDLSAPWTRLTVSDVFAQFAGLDLGKAIDDVAWFRTEATKRGYTIQDADSFSDIFFRIFLQDIEPHLGLDKPVILHEYPQQMASLSRLKADDQRFAERFEVYIGGLELCNAFSELTDAAEQCRRLEEEQYERAIFGRERLEIDPDFIEAVGQMPKAAGIALGVDRLVMLLTNAPTIRDVLFFPASDLFGGN